MTLIPGLILQLIPGLPLKLIPGLTLLILIPGLPLLILTPGLLPALRAGDMKESGGIHGQGEGKRKP